MKSIAIHSGQARRAPSVRVSGFTLPEMMVTLAIFSMVVIGVVSVNMFGLRMIELTEPKMLADAQARRLLNQFVQDVREADAAFVLEGATITNEGSGLRLEYWVVQNNGENNGEPDGVTITTNLTTYEWDPSAMELIRQEIIDGAEGPFESMAQGVSNPAESQIFRRERSGWNDDLAENHIPLVDASQSPAIIAMHLIFSSLYPTEYPVGSEHYYKAYQLRSKVAFRSH